MTAAPCAAGAGTPPARDRRAQLEERVGAKVLPHSADALGKLGDTIARHIPEIDRFADAVGQNIGRALDAAVPLVKGFASGLQSVTSVLAPLIQHGARRRQPPAPLRRRERERAQPSGRRGQGPGHGHCRTGLQRTTRRLGHRQRSADRLQRGPGHHQRAHGRQPVVIVVIAIAVLAAGFVLAYNTLKPFHDATGSL